MNLSSTVVCKGAISPLAARKLCAPPPGEALESHAITSMHTPGRTETLHKHLDAPLC